MKRLILAMLALCLAHSIACAQRTTATANPDVYLAPASGCTSGYWYFASGNVSIANCGNDATADGTQTHPFATCQGAVNSLYSKWDLVGQFAPVLHVGMGTSPVQFYYARCALSGRLLGQPGALAPLVVGGSSPVFKIGNYNPFVIIGDPNNVSGAFFVSGDFGNPGDGPALSGTDVLLKAQGFAVDSGGAAQDCMDFMSDSLLDLSNILWGACGNGVGAADYNVGIGIAFNTHLIISGPLSVSSGNMGALMQLGQNSSFYPNNNGQSKINVNFGGGTFQAAAIVIGGNSVGYTNGLSFTGSFTGGGLQIIESSTIENGTGAGPNTCPAGLILGHATLVQDNSVCR